MSYDDVTEVAAEFLAHEIYDNWQDGYKVKSLYDGATRVCLENGLDVQQFYLKIGKYLRPLFAESPKMREIPSTHPELL